MEIKVNASELSKKLEQAVKVIATKNVMPILADAMFDVRQDVILLTTSDSEIWLSLKCPIISCEQEARFCVNAHDLLELVKNLGDKDVVIILDEQSSHITCDYGNGNFTMPYDNADEFSLSSTGNEGLTTIIVDGKRITNAIGLTSFAVGNSITKPVMNGIHFDFSENRMVASSTNTHKVAIYKDNGVSCNGNGSFTMPKKPLSVLCSILDSTEGDVKISFNTSVISVSNAWFKISARLLEGRFYDCESLTKAERPIKVAVDNGSLLQALRRVMPMTNEMSNLVVMFFEQGQVTVSADNAVFGKSASETIPCDCDTNMKIGFKCSDLIEIIKNIDDDNVVMEMSDPMKGAVIYALSTYSREEYVSLLASSQTEQQQNG